MAQEETSDRTPPPDLFYVTSACCTPVEKGEKRSATYDAAGSDDKVRSNEAFRYLAKYAVGSCQNGRLVQQRAQTYRWV